MLAFCSICADKILMRTNILYLLVITFALSGCVPTEESKLPASSVSVTTKIEEEPAVDIVTESFVPLTLQQTRDLAVSYGILIDRDNGIDTLDQYEAFVSALAYQAQYRYPAIASEISPEVSTIEAMSSHINAYEVMSGTTLSGLEWTQVKPLYGFATSSYRMSKEDFLNSIRKELGWDTRSIDELANGYGIKLSNAESYSANIRTYSDYIRLRKDFAELAIGYYPALSLLVNEYISVDDAMRPYEIFHENYPSKQPAKVDWRNTGRLLSYMRKAQPMPSLEVYRYELDQDFAKSAQRLLCEFGLETC